MVMADKKFSFKSGNDALRPVTNAKCVMAQGFGSLHEFISDLKPVLMPALAVGSINMSNSRFSTTAASGMTTSVVMKNPILIPYAGVKFNVHIDALLQGLKVIIYHGYNEGVTSSISNVSKYSSGDLLDGDSFSFPVNSAAIESSTWDQNDRYYRIGFFSSELEMSLNDIKEAIRLGYIAITYEDKDSEVVARNPRPTEIIEASKSAKTPSQHHNFVLTHVSDLHGHGIALLNALKFSKAINSQALMVTGDVVVQSSYDGYDYVHELCQEFALPSFLTTGNHDGVGASASSFNSGFIGPMATAFGYQRSSTSVAYYYKDLATPKIRIIVLDCCDTSASYRINSVGSAQLTWLQNTLASTPNGYGVIIAMHQPVGKLTAASVTAHPSFADWNDELDGVNYSFANTTWTGASGIKSAVDSFIANGGEFIMYAVGHVHSDVVGIISGTAQTQLMAAVASPNRMLDMQYDNVALGDGRGKAQDVINAYVIDRKRHAVRVVRVGANMTTDLKERLVEEFNYA